MGLIVVIVPLSIWWHLSRSHELLESWASSNGFEIVHFERRWFRRGPYFWSTSKGLEVFHVTVTAPEGRTRDAFVRVGGYWMGLFSSNVDSTWDDVTAG